MHADQSGSPRIDARKTPGDRWILLDLSATSGFSPAPNFLAMRMVVLLLLIGAVGCSRATTTADIDPTKDRLGKIAHIYLKAEHELQRPLQGIDDLKPAIKKRGFGDEIWISENDGQPFVIVWVST